MAPPVATWRAQRGRNRRAHGPEATSASRPRVGSLPLCCYARVHFCTKTAANSGVRGRAFSMPALRIRRRLPAGLNGPGRQMFVVVNKICGLPGRPLAAARGYGCLTISRTTRKEISIQPALTGHYGSESDNNPVARATVEAFYRALANRDMDTLATFLDEQVKWTISGQSTFCRSADSASARPW